MAKLHKPISLAEINSCIRLFGQCQKSFMHSEKRAGLRSVLFDVPRRSSIGWHCTYRTAPEFLRRLSQKMSPEGIAARMKRLCSRPYYLTLSIVMCSYLGARQQMMLDQGLAPGEAFAGERMEDLGFVVDWWRRACSSYRNDGLLLPEQAADTQPILPPSAVEQLDSRLRGMNAETANRLRRLAATLELYCFILHGEQRDGIFGHGPYAVEDGRHLVVLEFTDLQNDFLPWAETKVRNPYPNLALVMRLRNVKARFHLFGSMLLDPADIAPHLEAAGVFTCAASGSVESLPFGDIGALQRCAADAQNELYLKAAEWPPRFQAEYGVHLFANHLRSFFHLAGFGNSLDEEIRAQFQAAAAEITDRLLSQPGSPSMWKFMATTEGEFFWPAINSDEVIAHHVRSQA